MVSVGERGGERERGREREREREGGRGREMEKEREMERGGGGGVARDTPAEAVVAVWVEMDRVWLEL